MELGIWDIWERPLFFTCKATEEYYLLKSGQTLRKKRAIKKNKRISISAYACKHIFIFKHTQERAG